MKTAVVGIGNPLRRDDGIGIILVEKLREMKLPNIDCIDAGSGGVHLLPFLSKYKRIILVDAVHFNAEPGDTKVFTLQDLKTSNMNPLSVHMLDTIQIIELYRELQDKELDIIVFGIQPYDTSHGTTLSSTVEEKLPEILRNLVETITEYHNPLESPR